jgi:hypothetical protein
MSSFAALRGHLSLPLPPGLLRGFWLVAFVAEEVVVFGVREGDEFDDGLLGDREGLEVLVVSFFRMFFS